MTTWGTRTIPTTNFTQRTAINTTYSDRKSGIFLMTQLLDYLMTQDDNYIVLQNSYEDTQWTPRPLI